MNDEDRARLSPRERKMSDLRADRDGYACACAQSVLVGDIDQARIEAEAYGRACQQLNDMIRGSDRV